MSIHNPTYPSKADLLAASSKPIAGWIKTAALVSTVVGLAAFIAGALMSPDRIWRAFHFHWLYFSAISSGAVVFVAVFRIVTARWSRSIARLLEGYVAFLPVSWLFLVLSVTIGGKHIFPWVADPNSLPNAERLFWLGNHTFFALREIGILTLLYALQIWFVYNSLRIDVAQLPEWGAKWAAGLRARMRAGWGEERRELHTQHSLQGKIAVAMTIVFGFGWMLLHYDLSMALDVFFFSTLWGWWSFMTGINGALMSFAIIFFMWRKHFNSPTIYEIMGDLQIHDLGKLRFGWTAFWGYTTFAQLLIIWYGNIGEETHYFRLRLIDPWLPVSVRGADAGLRGAVPGPHLEGRQDVHPDEHSLRCRVVARDVSPALHRSLPVALWRADGRRAIRLAGTRHGGAVLRNLDRVLHAVL